MLTSSIHCAGLCVCCCCLHETMCSILSHWTPVWPAPPAQTPCPFCLSWCPACHHIGHLWRRGPKVCHCKAPACRCSPTTHQQFCLFVRCTCTNTTVCGGAKSARDQVEPVIEVCEQNYLRLSILILFHQSVKQNTWVCSSFWIFLNFNVWPNVCCSGNRTLSTENRAVLGGDTPKFHSLKGGWMFNYQSL